MLSSKHFWFAFTDVRQLSVPPSKKLLVLVNPFSGPGTALSLFQERVVPMFAEAGILYHLIVTGGY
jgi:sphingosine kinase